MKPKISDQDIEFIVMVARGEPSISIAELVKRHKDHGGLPHERASSEVVQVFEAGYIDASASVTDAGTEWLKAR